MFQRRPETPLTESESRAFRKSAAAIKATTEEDWKILEEFYAAPQHETYARKDLATLVNNWNGEIDRARVWRKRPAPQTNYSAMKAELTAIEDAISTHPANRESVFHDADASDDLRIALKALRARSGEIKAILSKPA